MKEKSIKEGSGFRPPSRDEHQLFHRLMEAEFPGKSAIVDQLHGVRVRSIDPEGSLELQPSSGSKKAEVIRRIPVEAAGRDDDGIIIHVLLHVVDGIVKELEIYKDDGSVIKSFPRSHNLDLVVL